LGRRWRSCCDAIDEKDDAYWLAASSDKRLRAELAEGLGYYPASLTFQDVARYREQIAKRKAREEAGERDGWAPGGYKWRQWDHLKETRRQAGGG
jgi:hypothetical protein